MAEKNCSQKENSRGETNKGLFLVINKEYFQETNLNAGNKKNDDENEEKKEKKEEIIIPPPGTEEKEVKDRKSCQIKKGVKLIDFFKKNSWWLIPFILIVIAIFISSYFRMMPSYLPLMDELAEEKILEDLRNQISEQVNQDYFHLPLEKRNLLIEKELRVVITENKDEVAKETARLSRTYKDYFQDEKGGTYLISIDSYLWYSQARNVINHGHLGDKMINGTSYFSLRDGRLDKETTLQLHPYFMAYIYKGFRLFDRDISLMRVMFLIPVIIIGLSIIPAFFIGRKISGNAGGFFAAVFLAINVPLMERTIGGIADTDFYNVFFPLLICWFILEAYTTKKRWFSWLLPILTGFVTGAYAATWGGWYFIFLTILTTMVIVLAIRIITNFSKSQYKVNLNSIRETEVKKQFFILTLFMASSLTFCSFFSRDVINVFKTIINIFSWTGKSHLDITTGAAASIWPKVQTTVAEFMKKPMLEFISEIGGVFFLILAVLGLLLILVKKNEKIEHKLVYFTLLAVWLGGTVYASTRGIRFGMLVIPPFAIALGMMFGLSYEKISQWMSEGMKLERNTSEMLVLIVLALFLVNPFIAVYQTSKAITPEVNDDWYDALTKIKEDSSDAIITSWWDFGHWFVAIAERRVTFDGGDQKKRIHWVGKILLTEDEGEAIAILRMLNCGQEKATEKLEEYTNDPLRAVQILYEIFPFTDRAKAYRKYQELGLTKEQAETMLELTHCKDLIPSYFITSGDMVGKSFAWGHFGSWDFEKAAIYFKTKKMLSDEAAAYLINNFNFTEEQAVLAASEIKRLTGDQWISPQPVMENLKPCERLSEKKIRCVKISQQEQKLNIDIDLDFMNVTLENNPSVNFDSIVYATEKGIEKKELPGKHIGLSLILVPNGEDYQFAVTDPLLAKSMFVKLYFFKSHGTKCFEKFNDLRQHTGERIITWKVDYDCRQDNKIYFE